MSDANEKEWNATGRPSASAGETNKAGLEDGVSSHSQIKDSNESLGQGHGQGQRASGMSSKSVSWGGKTFKFGG